MPNEFQFKQFCIENNSSGQKLSSDAVLLGAWINENPKTILDIGTGCGILSLMLAQKTTAFIDAVDIDETAFKSAIHNITLSSWANRINVIHADIHNYISTCNTKYDLVVCNPPYFIDSLKPANDKASIAKHAGVLVPENLFRLVKSCISTDGSFYIVIPANLFQLYKDIALLEGFYIHASLHIKPRNDKPCNRVLLKFIMQRVVEVKEELIIKDEKGEYTEAYKELTKSYYIKF